MRKKDTTRRRERQSEVVEEDNVGDEEQVKNEQIIQTEERKEVELRREDEGDEGDVQIDTDVEVKGNTPTVVVTWEASNEEKESDDTERTSSAAEKHPEIISADAVGPVEEAPALTPETKMERDAEECGDLKAEKHPEIISADAVGPVEEAPALTPETKMERDAEECGDLKAVNGKRRADPSTDASPSKKTKLINDGFCIFIGNLNHSKTSEEIKGSLVKYLMTQSLLFEDVRLDRSRKHAFVDLVSEMDLTKALTLNGEKILDKPVKIAKAKVKSERVKAKAPRLDKKAKDARCLFLKNVPYDATKEDILKVFPKAAAVRFPGGAKTPSHGIAFVEFKNEATAKRTLEKKKEPKIHGRVLIVDRVGEAKVPEASPEAAAPPNDTLFVGNLSYNVKEKDLKKVFQKAVSINIPQNKGGPRGYAFVGFATVADAEKALQSSQNMRLCKKPVRVQFCNIRAKQQHAEPSKTLIVVGLTEKTTAEVLKSAFEGAVGARIPVGKATGASQRFGFVDFESDESSQAAKEAMEDCEIDGNKVTVDYARPKSDGEKKRGLAGPSPGRRRGSSMSKEKI